MGRVMFDELGWNPKQNQSITLFKFVECQLLRMGKVTFDELYVIKERFMEIDLDASGLVRFIFFPSSLFWLQNVANPLSIQKNDVLDICVQSGDLVSFFVFFCCKHLYETEAVQCFLISIFVIWNRSGRMSFDFDIFTFLLLLAKCWSGTHNPKGKSCRSRVQCKCWERDPRTVAQKSPIVVGLFCHINLKFWVLSETQHGYQNGNQNDDSGFWIVVLGSLFQQLHWTRDPQLWPFGLWVLRDPTTMIQNSESSF